MPIDSAYMYAITKGDSRATNHYLQLQDQYYLTNKQTNIFTQITLLNNKAILLTIQGILNISPVLLYKAKQALVFLSLKSSSLISLYQLCNDNCKISLNKKDMKVYKDEI